MGRVIRTPAHGKWDIIKKLNLLPLERFVCHANEQNEWQREVCVRCECVGCGCGCSSSGKKGNKRKAALAILIYVGRRRFAKLLNAASGIRTGNQKAEQEMAVGKCWENGEPNGCRKAADRGLQITLKYSSRLKQWLRTRPFVRTCT